jgi:hypothetical protein
VDLYLHTHTCPHVVCGTGFTLTTYSGFQIKEAGVGQGDIATDEECLFYQVKTRRKHKDISPPPVIFSDVVEVRLSGCKVRTLAK